MGPSCQGTRGRQGRSTQDRGAAPRQRRVTRRAGTPSVSSGGGVRHPALGGGSNIHRKGAFDLSSIGGEPSPGGGTSRRRPVLRGRSSTPVRCRDARDGRRKAEAVGAAAVGAPFVDVMRFAVQGGRSHPPHASASQVGQRGALRGREQSTFRPTSSGLPGVHGSLERRRPRRPSGR